MKYIFIFLFVCGSLFSQTQEKIYVKYFTKKNKVVFRILPKDKAAYDEMTSKALDIVRYTSANGVLSNSVSVNDLLRAYFIADTAKWMKLMRKDKDKTGFVYNMLYGSNGNEKISGTDKAKFDKMTFDMMLLSCDLDRDIAIATGLYFADSAVNNSTKYVYKIAMYTASTSATSNNLVSVNVDASVLSTNKQITGLKGKPKNNFCTINWKAADYNSDYSGYNIYRSADSVNFEKVNRAPVILIGSQFEKNKQFIFYSDTMPERNKKYFYAVKGINFFGEEGDLSNIIPAVSISEIRSTPVIDTIKVVQNKIVKLKWRMENNAETSYPKKYILLRSDKDNGIYKLIHEGAGVLGFVDRSPEPVNFYKVGAVLMNNDTLYSYTRFAHIIDTIPPSAPKNLKAIVDKKGVVTISWKKNSEADLQGYKIFKSNRLQDEFVQMNNKFVTDTAYSDKLNLKTLSKKIYYKIAASDDNFNTSELSEAIEVKRPDTIPPQAPILSSVSQQTNGLIVNYILSSSDDVAKETLLRKKSTDTDFKEYYTFAKKDSVRKILDTLVEPGETYVYRIRSSDEDGNTSYSRELNFLFETGFRKKVSNIKYEVDRTAKHIHLQWTYDEKNIDRFVIYRSKKDEPLTIVKTLNGSVMEFTDKTVNMGNDYEYRIKAALKNGTESIISNAIKIEY